MKNISKIILLVFLFLSCSKNQNFTKVSDAKSSNSFEETIIEKSKEGITFKVCDVKTADKLLPEQPAEKVLQQLAMQTDGTLFGSTDATPNPVLLCSSLEKGNIVGTSSNAFAQAVYMAYAQHRPLVISPDMIWLLITQGFATHVEENAEELRDIFVDHEGQINLDVKRTSYQPTSRIWWEGIFPDFSKAIAENTKEEVWGLVAPKFSTTTLVEKAAFEITLMDAMSPYFQYSISIICGIPEITLEGKTEDWEKIEKQIEQLNNYDLDWWTDDLKNIIGEFKKASHGKVDEKFWGNIFDQKRMSVGCGTAPYITGWMLDFFPYLKNGKDKDGNVMFIKNPRLVDMGSQPQQIPGQQFKMEMENIPGGLSRAKVLLNDNGNMTTLNFNAGFVGFSQDKKTMALRPDIQWFVTDLQLPPTQEEIKKYEKSFH